MIWNQDHGAAYGSWSIQSPLCVLGVRGLCNELPGKLELAVDSQEHLAPSTSSNRHLWTRKFLQPAFYATRHNGMAVKQHVEIWGLSMNGSVEKLTFQIMLLDHCGWTVAENMVELIAYEIEVKEEYEYQRRSNDPPVLGAGDSWSVIRQCRHTKGKSKGGHPGNGKSRVKSMLDSGSKDPRGDQKNRVVTTNTGGRDQFAH
ncbi:hypothetical protein F4604DRAFT_1687725 [Suillus subluteus]|nr:hypothetical protein F4604DRAFT_1687725 [Suillus subluteus]